eukprot:gene7400-15114_t
MASPKIKYRNTSLHDLVDNRHPEEHVHDRPTTAPSGHHTRNSVNFKGIDPEWHDQHSPTNMRASASTSIVFEDHDAPVNDLTRRHKFLTMGTGPGQIKKNHSSKLIQPNKAITSIDYSKHNQILSQIMEGGDLIISIENCCNCTNHHYSVRHNEQKYTDLANISLRKLAQKVHVHNLHVRVGVIRLTPTEKRIVEPYPVGYGSWLETKLSDASWCCVTPEPDKLHIQWVYDARSHNGNNVDSSHIFRKFQIESNTCSPNITLLSSAKIYSFYLDDDDLIRIGGAVKDAARCHTSCALSSVIFNSNNRRKATSTSTSMFSIDAITFPVKDTRGVEVCFRVSANSNSNTHTDVVYTSTGKNTNTDMQYNNNNTSTEPYSLSNFTDRQWIVAIGSPSGLIFKSFEGQVEVPKLDLPGRWNMSTNSQNCDCFMETYDTYFMNININTNDINNTNRNDNTGTQIAIDTDADTQTTGDEDEDEDTQIDTALYTGINEKVIELKFTYISVTAGLTIPRIRPKAGTTHNGLLHTTETFKIDPLNGYNNSNGSNSNHNNHELEAIAVYLNKKSKIRIKFQVKIKSDDSDSLFNIDIYRKWRVAIGSNLGHVFSIFQFILEPNDSLLVASSYTFLDKISKISISKLICTFTHHSSCNTYTTSDNTWETNRNVIEVESDEEGQVEVPKLDLPGKWIISTNSENCNAYFETYTIDVLKLNNVRNSNYSNNNRGDDDNYDNDDDSKCIYLTSHYLLVHSNKNLTIPIPPSSSSSPASSNDVLSTLSTALIQPSFGYREPLHLDEVYTLKIYNEQLNYFELDLDLNFNNDDNNGNDSDGIGKSYSVLSAVLLDEDTGLYSTTLIIDAIAMNMIAINTDTYNNESIGIEIKFKIRTVSNTNTTSTTVNTDIDTDRNVQTDKKSPTKPGLKTSTSISTSTYSEQVFNTANYKNWRIYLGTSTTGSVFAKFDIILLPFISLLIPKTYIFLDLHSKIAISKLVCTFTHMESKKVVEVESNEKGKVEVPKLDLPGRWNITTSSRKCNVFFETYTVDLLKFKYRYNTSTASTTSSKENVITMLTCYNHLQNKNIIYDRISIKKPSATATVAQSTLTHNNDLQDIFAHTSPTLLEVYPKAQQHMYLHMDEVYVLQLSTSELHMLSGIMDIRRGDNSSNNGNDSDGIGYNYSVLSAVLLDEDTGIYSTTLIIDAIAITLPIPYDTNHNPTNTTNTTTTNGDSSGIEIRFKIRVNNIIENTDIDIDTYTDRNNVHTHNVNHSPTKYVSTTSPSTPISTSIDQVFNMSNYKKYHMYLGSSTTGSVFIKLAIHLLPRITLLPPKSFLFQDSLTQSKSNGGSSGNNNDSSNNNIVIPDQIVVSLVRSIKPSVHFTTGAPTSMTLGDTISFDYNITAITDSTSELSSSLLLYNYLKYNRSCLLNAKIYNKNDILLNTNVEIVADVKLQPAHQLQIQLERQESGIYPFIIGILCAVEVPNFVNGVYTLFVNIPGYCSDNTTEKYIFYSSSTSTSIPSLMRIEKSKKFLNELYSLPENHVRFILSWNAEPKDLDIHCYNTNNSKICYSTKNADGMSLDIDVTNGYGPETVTLPPIVTGVGYTLYVHHCSGSSTLSQSDAKMKVLLGISNGHVKTITDISVVNNSSNHKVWEVLSIDTSKRLRVHNVLTSNAMSAVCSSYSSSTSRRSTSSGGGKDSSIVYEFE